MIRYATAADIDAVAAIYERIHTAQEQGSALTGWRRGIYPTRATAQAALTRGDLFVQTADEAGHGPIVGAAVLNQQQVDVYAGAPWTCDHPDHEIMVMHTLVIDPREKGRGYGRAFEAYYARHARERGCRSLRIDTNEKNTAARRFYRALGYREIAVRRCLFNGLPDVSLVLLEKVL